MRKFLLVVLLALPGCFSMQPLPTGKVDPAMPPLEVAARKAIIEANGDLAAVYRTIADNKRLGLWTAEQRDRYVAEADKYADEVDRASAFVVKKQYTDAQLKAAATQTLIQILLKEVQKAKAKQGAELEPVFIGA